MKINERAVVRLSAATVILSLATLATAWLAQPFPSEELSRDPRADWTTLEAMSPHLVRAIVAAEDQRFWRHSGVDLRAIDRAVWQNLSERRQVSGASTITMQLIKILHPERHRRTLPSKLRQARDALALERSVAKQDILENYLNRAYFGAAATGVAAASQSYFNKPASRLSLGEAALLAGLPRAPARLNPLLNPAGARARQRYVLGRMTALGMVSASEAQAAGCELLRR